MNRWHHRNAAQTPLAIPLVYTPSTSARAASKVSSRSSVRDAKINARLLYVSVTSGDLLVEARVRSICWCVVAHGGGKLCKPRVQQPHGEQGLVGSITNARETYALTKQRATARLQWNRSQLSVLLYKCVWSRFVHFQVKTNQNDPF